MTPRAWRIAFAVVVIACAAILQTVVLARLPLPGAVPDLTLVVVVALALGGGRDYGAYCGFGAGLALDLLPPATGAVGAAALGLTLVGWLAGRVRDPRGLAGIEVGALVAGLAAFNWALTSALGLLLGDSSFEIGSWVGSSLAYVGYATVLGLGGIPLVTALMRRLPAGGATREIRRLDQRQRDLRQAGVQRN